MLNYVITSNRRLQKRKALAFIGESQTIKYDIRPIEDDIGTVTIATWTIKTGDASISNEILTTNRSASAVITTPSAGSSKIELKLTAGVNIHVTQLIVTTKDIESQSNDYSFRCIN